MTDLHVHTFFCDGQCSPEEAVRSSLRRGVTRLGLVAHSYVPFDGCCIRPEDIKPFQQEVARLKYEYRGQIDIYCGIEVDLYSTQSMGGFDYSIGSVHYLKQGDSYFAIDDTPEILRKLIDVYYGGDAVACAIGYFKAVALLKEKHPDFIGHFDLIKKFRSVIPLNEHDPRYVGAWQDAALELLKLGKPFEVNTGGISRGWLDEPYPSWDIADFILKNGGRLLLSSDAHCAADICGEFERFANWTVH